MPDSWSVFKVLYVGYSTNQYPNFHYILILGAHCIMPIDLLPLFILTGKKTSHHHCLKTLASRQHMQTQVDTKSSLIASRLPALVVTACLLFVWILRVLWDFSFKMRGRSSAPAHISVPVCLSATHRLLMSLSPPHHLSAFISFISLPTQVWRSLSLFPSTSLCLCCRTDN